MKKLMMAVVWSVAILVTSLNVYADDKIDAEKIVTRSVEVLTNFANDPEMKWFQKHIKDAKGILIIPSLLKAGFIFGGSGGTGAMLRNNVSNKQWSSPAFYSMGSVTWGLQIGAQKAEVVLLVMTDKGMDALLSTKLQLGADASVAAGPVGAGTKAATADVLQFSRAKGVFGGLTLEGSVISPRDSLNGAYYGKSVSPLEILVKEEVSNVQADKLKTTLTVLSK